MSGGTDPVSLTLDAAMRRALELAARGPAYGPNPRVGCVIVAPDSDGRWRVLAEGFHRGAGTPHAEAAALSDAAARGVEVVGATAVVTLEPCAHTGRTPPCAKALHDAGIASVVFAVEDPNPAATGGGTYLRAHGVDIVVGLLAAEGEELLRPWLAAVRSGRPYVTLKTATTLDGRVAAGDGTSRWITDTDARADAHELRATVDAIVVGTGTVLTDDPQLTARPARRPGEPAVAHQPLRVVIGRRDIPVEARVRGRGGRLVHLRTHDVDEALAKLAAMEVRHVLVEGGPTLATAFLRAGVVDELNAYVAPVLLGAGPTAVEDLGIATITHALRFRTIAVRALGPDALIVARREED